MGVQLSRRQTLTAGIGLGVLGLAACGGEGGAAPASASGDMVLGSATAPVTVIEYASASCSHCARWHQQVFPEFRRRYIDTNRVKYVFREFLTAPQSFAASSFLLARCAAANNQTERYFSVLGAIFRGQEEVFRTGETRPVLLRVAQATGMNESQFNACLRDEAALNALNDRVERAARQDGIGVTPTFVINGRKIEGEQSMAQLAAIIDPLLGANRPAALPAEPAAGSGAAPATGATPTPAGATEASGSASASSTAATAPTTAGAVTAATAATSGSPAR